MRKALEQLALKNCTLPGKEYMPCFLDRTTKPSGNVYRYLP